MSSNKKILIVSQYYPPDITAAAFRISETAELLAESGYDVTILTAMPHRIQASDQLLHQPPGVTVLRVPLFKLKMNNKYSYIMHYLSFMISSALRGFLLTGRGYNWVMASSPPLFVGASGWILALFKKTRFLLEVRDLWPDSAVAAGQLPPDGLLYNGGKWLERFLYRKADRITCVSEEMLREIAQSGGKSSQITVIYNGLREKDISSIPDEIPPKKDEFCITYVGNLGYLQGLTVLVEAAARLPEVNFHLVGAGVELPKMKRMVQQYCLRNVRFTPPCSKAQALMYMREADALYLPLKNNRVLSKTIPSKLFDYLGANKPIIYGLEGEGKGILGKLPGNLYFEPENLESLTDAIKLLQNEYPELSMKARGNRDFLRKHYTREEMVTRLRKLLESV
ncbi:glycosyltransferase family 4 protein [bacterium]|nr:glycosyltransferase family 4 protein [bacterium]